MQTRSSLISRLVATWLSLPLPPATGHAPQLEWNGGFCRQVRALWIRNQGQWIYGRGDLNSCLLAPAASPSECRLGCNIKRHSVKAPI